MLDAISVYSASRPEAATEPIARDGLIEVIDRRLQRRCVDGDSRCAPQERRAGVVSPDTLVLRAVERQ